MLHIVVENASQTKFRGDSLGFLRMGKYIDDRCPRFISKRPFVLGQPERQFRRPGVRYLCCLRAIRPASMNAGRRFRAASTAFPYRVHQT